MTYLGDFHKGATVRRLFTTVNTSGVPTTLAGTPVISAYEDGGTTEITAGITLTVDFDTRTGMHLIAVDTSDSNYEAGKDYHLVITTGTVSGSSVVGYVVAQFSIEARYGIGDSLLKRDMSAPSGAASRSPLNALRALRNRWAVSGGTLTVYQEDDTTSAWTSTTTGTAGADPITESNPA